MSKKIIFTPECFDEPDLEKYLDIPKPASNFIPDWYKQQPYFINNDEYGRIPSNNLSFKACIPFLDTLTTGYILYTHQDIRVVNDGKDQRFQWNTGPVPMIYRDTEQNLPVPPGFYKHHYAWILNYTFKLPKGYSCLITHPLNRFDLPFMTVSGIVDEGIKWSGQFTFWLKEDFKGLIPKNTPIAQIIPFKNEKWIAEKDDSLKTKEENKKAKHIKDTHLNGYYKKFIHKKKSFK